MHRDIKPHNVMIDHEARKVTGQTCAVIAHSVLLPVVCISATRSGHNNSTSNDVRSALLYVIVCLQ